MQTILDRYEALKEEYANEEIHIPKPEYWYVETTFFFRITIKQIKRYSTMKTELCYSINQATSKSEREEKCCDIKKRSDP